MHEVAVTHNVIMAVEVRVPFDIWIILVICTGGLYLIVMLFQGDSTNHTTSSPQSSQTTGLDIGVLVELIKAMLTGADHDRLRYILNGRHIVGETQDTLIQLCALALGAISEAQEAGRPPENIVKIAHARLSAQGVPIEFANASLHAFVIAIKSLEKSNDAKAQTSTVDPEANVETPGHDPELTAKLGRLKELNDRGEIADTDYEEAVRAAKAEAQPQ